MEFFKYPAYITDIQIRDLTEAINMESDNYGKHPFQIDDQNQNHTNLPKKKQRTKLVIDEDSIYEIDLDCIDCQSKI